MTRTSLALAFIGYLAFVVYGSLVPFELRDYTFEEAVNIFLGIPYLSLGVTSRADWVANILLYAPLAFLGCAWIAGAAFMTLSRFFAVFLVFLICISVAVGVEFTQIFFVPRTVSLNDLLAESMGTLAGIAIWVSGRERLRRLSAAFAFGGRESVVAAITLYLLAYVALSLFPFDFLVSAKEFADKFSSNKLGWLLAGECSGWVRCIAPRIGEVLAVAPVGMLAAVAARRALSLPRMFFAGALLGLILELAQLLIASGITQGLSVLLRGAGFVAGALLGRALLHFGPAVVARAVWRTALVAALPYGLALAAVNGWFKPSSTTTDAALERLAGIRLMPFYYHYYTSERAAVASVLAQIAMYAPIGIAVWAHQAASYNSAARRRWLVAALAAATLSLVMELGKLWGPPKVHPDFTNLLIGAASAAFTYALGHWLESILSGGQILANRASHEAPPATAPRFTWIRPPAHSMLGSLLAAIAAGAGVLAYPVGTPVLLLGLLLYGVALYRRPTLWLLVIPVLLPILDLSPITGRRLLDEFDMLVLVTLAVLWWRTWSLPRRRYPSRAFPLVFILLWSTWIVSTMRGVWPMLGGEGPWLSVGSHSPLETWQVGKGLLWALLLAPLLRRVPADDIPHARQLVLRGLVAGLVILALVVAWERHVFVGLADFGSVFRVTGTFASMHRGGAYIEAFIAFAFPALAVWTLTQRTWSWRLFGILGAAAASYAMLVTFSRAGYAALMVGMLVVALGVALRRIHLTRWGAIAVAGVLVAAVVVAVPVLSGGYAQHRLAKTAEDFSVRLAHWSRAVGLMDDGAMATLTGMGFGRYPTLYLYAATERRLPGSYSIQREESNAYLRLGAGGSGYLEQRVKVDPGASYTLSARVRTRTGKAALSVPICEKALLYSFECTWAKLPASADGTGWAQASVQVAVGAVGAGGNWPHRPTRLSLLNPSGEDAIEVDDLSFKTSDGRELLVNGGFESGADRWLFVSDRDFAWHIDQQALETYFAQGLLGLVALAALLLATGRAVWPVFRRGDLFAVAMIGAVAAFLTVGLLSSVVDTARLSTLFYFAVLVVGLLTPQDLSRRKSRRSRPPHSPTDNRPDNAVSG